MPATSKAQQRLAFGEEAAYIAGFFDGEGSVGIREHNKPGTKAGSDRRTPHFRLQITFTNRDLAILTWLQNRLGGTICCKKRASERWAQAFELRLDKRADTQRALELMLPHLQIKRRHAEVGLAFLGLGLSRVVFTARGKTWPRRIQHPDDVDARRLLRKQLTEMNLRGVERAS